MQVSVYHLSHLFHVKHPLRRRIVGRKIDAFAFRADMRNTDATTPEASRKGT